MKPLVLAALARAPSVLAAQEPAPFALEPATLPGTDEALLRGLDTGCADSLHRFDFALND